MKQHSSEARTIKATRGSYPIRVAGLAESDNLFALPGPSFIVGIPVGTLGALVGMTVGAAVGALEGILVGPLG